MSLTVTILLTTTIGGVLLAGLLTGQMGPGREQELREHRRNWRHTYASMTMRGADQHQIDTAATRHEQQLLRTIERHRQ